MVVGICSHNLIVLSMSYLQCYIVQLNHDSVAQAADMIVEVVKGHSADATDINVTDFSAWSWFILNVCQVGSKPAPTEGMNNSAVLPDNFRVVH